MDPTEDLSARVLLKHILSTEPPRTPVTRSDSQEPSSSGVRRSSRLSRRNAEAQTPQDVLRRSLKHKIRESITRKSFATTKGRTPSVVLEKRPSSLSMLVSSEDTPRHLLRNILQTEPVKSPVVHKREQSEEPDQQSADGTALNTHSSIELSGLDLPDLTISNVASIAKGLSRKRERQTLNVTAFVKRLKSENDAGEEPENTTGDLSSLSLSSSSSLSLKTPFPDVRTEKRGLQRKVSNRRKITEGEFEAAVSEQHVGDVSSVSLVQGEGTDIEGFTLGLSKLSMPDMTADIVNCNTALYDQPDAMSSNFSIIAAQDKPTVTLSQLQIDVRETEQEEEECRMEREKSVNVLPREEEEEEAAAVEPENEEPVSESGTEESAAEAEPRTEEGPNQLDDNATDASESEEEEDTAESETNADAQTEEEGAANSLSEENDNLDELTEKEEVSPDSQRDEEEMVEKEECLAGSQTVESSQSEEEECELGFQTEEVETVALSQNEAEAEAEAGSEEEEEEVSPDSQTEEEDAADSQTDEVAAVSSSQDDAASQSKEEAEDVAESQTEEEEEQPEGGLEVISRRTHRSEGALILPIMEASHDSDNGIAAGLPDAKSKMYSTFELNTSAQLGVGDISQPQIRKLDMAEVSDRDQEHVSRAENKSRTENENPFHPHGLTLDAEVSERESVASPEDAQNSAEQEEEEWDDEEEEVVQSKTPAFVKMKRNFFHSDSPASPSVLKNTEASLKTEALPAAKPKQVRQRKKRTARKQAVLPKTYLMSVFRHFAKTTVSADVYPVLNEITDKFLDRLAEDLETYAAHAKRKTIEVEDAILLLKRQGYVNDKVPVEVLIEKYLRMEQRKLLIPMATSGNVVIPKKRK